MPLSLDCCPMPTGAAVPHSYTPAAVVLDPARRLDLEADALLQQGDHARAERLAHRAAELRGWSA